MAKRIILSDSPTVVFRAEADGKIGVNSQSLQERQVALAGQHLEVRWHEGKVAVDIVDKPNHQALLDLFGSNAPMDSLEQCVDRIYDIFGVPHDR